MRVFVAGATGAIGRFLIPHLIASGHQVTGTTRSPGRAAQLERAGVTPAVVDGLDRAGVIEAVRAAQPDVIIHQMTALTSLRSFRHFDREFATTNELRTRGTDYLLEAARQAGTPRFIAQSFVGWTNARTGGPVKSEADPLDPDPLPATAKAMAAIRHVEQSVPQGVPEGLVLRYGIFYGPGASGAMLDVVRKRMMPVIGGGTGIWSFTEVTDAAAATVAAITHGAPGLYNVVDDDPAPAHEWIPVFAEALGAKKPLKMPAAIGARLLGPYVVAMMTSQRAASNAKARAQLDWAPRFASWREGFPAAIAQENQDRWRFVR